MKNNRDKVLVIDKDMDFIMQVIAELDDVYDVISSLSLFEAMETIRTAKPDVILLDYETLQNGNTNSIDAIRLAKDGSEVPVIFLSSINKRNYVKNALKLRPDWYLLKPPSKEKLVAEIEKALGREAGESSFSNEPPSSDDISELLKEAAKLLDV